MKRPILTLLLTAVLAFGWSRCAWSALSIEITESAEGALPVAVVPFDYTGKARLPQDVAGVIRNDLARSGRFETLAPERMLTQPSRAEQVDYHNWRVLQQDYLVVGSISELSPGRYQILFQLLDVYKGGVITGYTLETSSAHLRTSAHHIADIVYEKLIGEPGAFATRIAYITSKHLGKGRSHSALYIADSDGYDAQRIVNSDEPLMSPAWSPDGSRLAYVSFEGGRPAIYVQQVYTGKRRRIAAFKGINGAPAWSPDGRKLAMTLSKDGNPDIYVMDLASRKLRRITRHWAIDTEAAFSPDGRSLVFTSDRGGQPQIYRIALAGGRPERVTFEGSYNARASYSPDGRKLALVTRVGRDYRIGVLDLENGNLDVLSDGPLDESPSFAPNGRIIIYAAERGNRGLLATVSVDGSVQQQLATQSGDVREPAWSPYEQTSP
ncbi:MAG TPA: Tol-Pal system beta propeller repeat protein TolB [Chromatiaceae bacterium]|nr:Tol-Pal system beta propeller repeat protein TolB [Chromatiaceae bacterium]